MDNVRAFFVKLLLLCLCTSAIAQVSPYIPGQTVMGNASTSPAPAQPLTGPQARTILSTATAYSPAPPPQAAAAGMNTLTYGPAVTLGQNWFQFNMLGVTPVAGQAVQNADGSITLPGNDGSGFGANIATAHLVSGVLKGTGFGGGYYIEFVVKFTPTLGGASLPFPALWSLDTDFLSGNTLQWPGQPTGFHHRIENDFMQWPHNSLTFWEGNGLIDWFGYGSLSTPKISGVQITGTAGQFSTSTLPSGTLIVGNYISISGTFGGTGSITGYTNPTAYVISATNGTSTFTLQAVGGGALTTTAGTPTGLTYQYTAVNQPLNGEIHIGPSANPFLFSNYNRYGFLVTPASAATQGSILNYLNGVQVNYAAGAANVVWNLYSSGNAPPPVAGTTAGSLIDTLEMVLIMGTDVTCPMTIQSVTVWQASGAGNVTSSLWTPLDDAANDEYYLGANSRRAA